MCGAEILRYAQDDSWVAQRDGWVAQRDTYKVSDAVCRFLKLKLTMSSTSKITRALSREAVYTPYANGVYDVSVGLRPLGTDFGNGEVDGKVFQFDEKFESYRENVLRVRGADLNKHYGLCGYSDEVSGRVNETIVRQLVKEYPAYFRFNENRLVCALTGETVLFDETFQFVKTDEHDYESGLDALASQMQEDLAVVCIDGGRDWLSATTVQHRGW